MQHNLQASPIVRLAVLNSVLPKQQGKHFTLSTCDLQTQAKYIPPVQLLPLENSPPVMERSHPGKCISPSERCQAARQIFPSFLPLVGMQHALA